MNISYSELESKRFGMNIYRGQYDVFSINEIEHIVDNVDYDIIIVRYPTSTIYEHYRLNNLKKSKIIHADSLVYYSAPLQEINILPLRNNLIFETIGSANDSLLDHVVETIFSGYQNHYYANPCLSRSAIIEGYLEWAKSFTKTDDEGVTWLIKDGITLETVAFLACYFNKKNSVCDLKLGGVMPSFSGKGIYADFVRYAQNYFKNRNIKTMITSTQLQNIAVQRAWQKHGFRFDKSYETYHIVNEELWNRIMNS
jgi:ribosomal protein S18 acetylase RimI-like enzyme